MTKENESAYRVSLSADLRSSIEFARALLRRGRLPIALVTAFGAAVGYLAGNIGAQERYSATTVIRVGLISPSEPLERIPRVLTQVNYGVVPNDPTGDFRKSLFVGLGADAGSVDLQARVAETESRIVSIVGIAGKPAVAMKLSSEAADAVVKRHEELFKFWVGWLRDDANRYHKMLTGLERQRSLLEQTDPGTDKVASLMRSWAISNVNTDITKATIELDSMQRRSQAPFAEQTVVLERPANATRTLSADGRRRLAVAGGLVGFLMGFMWAALALRRKSASEQ